MRKESYKHLASGTVTIIAVIAILQTLASRTTVALQDGLRVSVRYIGDIFGTTHYLNTAYVWYLRVLLAAMVLGALITWSERRISAFVVAGIAAVPTGYLLIFQAAYFRAIFQAMAYEDWMLFFLPVGMLCISLLSGIFNLPGTARAKRTAPAVDDVHENDATVA